MRGIHWSPVNSPHKGQWCGAFMFFFIYVWINDWVNNCEAGDLRRYRAHYDVSVMFYFMIDRMRGWRQGPGCKGGRWESCETKRLVSWTTVGWWHTTPALIWAPGDWDDWRWRCTCKCDTVWYRCNVVNFHPNPHKRHAYLAREGELWGDFCEYNLWCIFNLRHCHTICKIMLYWTAL